MATLACLALIAALMVTGVVTVAGGLVAAGCVQLVAFTVAAPCPALFNTGLTPEQVKEFENLLKSLGEWKDLFPQVKDLSTVEGGFAALKKLPEALKTKDGLITKLREDLDAMRKAQLAFKAHGLRRKGQVSTEAARHLGGIALLYGLKGGQISGDRYEGLIKDILGMEVKAALTSSDIPLPVEYSGDVAELVGEFGAARLYATLFPLGAGTVKLPKLTTDPTFGLIAGSATVTEKSPQTAWVTFTAEKFGGLVRLPSELDEDSIVPIGQFLARYSARQLAYVEDYQVFRSTGAGSGLNGTAEGLVKSVVTDSKTLALATGDLAPSDVTLAKLRALRAVVDASALRMGAYYFHPSWEQKFAGLNTAGDKPYQANGLNGASLDGFPIRWVDAMPVYSTTDAASTVFGLFGDVSFQYLGVRGGIRFDTSTEAGFTTDEILVRALERLTTGKMATGAVAGIITAAS